MPEDTRDGDAEREEYLRAWWNKQPSPLRGEDGAKIEHRERFLLRLLAVRDAALREARAEIERLRNVWPHPNTDNMELAKQIIRTGKHTLAVATNFKPAIEEQFVRHIAAALADKERETIERCVLIAYEQRCERGTPWDLACKTIAEKLSALAARAPEAKP